VERVYKKTDTSGYIALHLLENKFWIIIA